MLTYQLGRQAVAAMNYFHRKALLQILERRQALVTAQAEQEEDIEGMISDDGSRQEEIRVS